MKTVTPLNEKAILRRLHKELPIWELKNGAIERTYVTGQWQLTMMAVNAIAFLAEAACHHPDLHVSFPQVTVRLSTHQPKGITARDFELAALIELQITFVPARKDALDGYEKGYKKAWIK